MSFDADSMDFDDMLDREDDVEFQSDEEPPMTSQLESDATLCSIELAAMVT